MSAALGYLCVALATGAVLLGDYALKVGADRGAPVLSAPLLAGASLYAASAAGWFLAMRVISLSQIGVAFSMFTLLALCAMGVFLFGERLLLREYLGIGLAIVSIMLMARLV